MKNNKHKILIFSTIILLIILAIYLFFLRNNRSVNLEIDASCLSNLEKDIEGKWISGPGDDGEVIIDFNTDGIFVFQHRYPGIKEEKSGTWIYNKQNKSINLKFNELPEKIYNIDSLTWSENSINLEVKYFENKNISYCDISRIYIDLGGEYIYKYVESKDYDLLFEKNSNNNNCLDLFQYLTPGNWQYTSENKRIQIIFNENSDLFIVYSGDTYKEIKGNWKLINNSEIEVNFDTLDDFWKNELSNKSKINMKIIYEKEIDSNTCKKDNFSIFYNENYLKYNN